MASLCGRVDCQLLVVWIAIVCGYIDLDLLVFVRGSHIFHCHGWQEFGDREIIKSGDSLESSQSDIPVERIAEGYV